MIFIRFARIIIFFDSTKPRKEAGQTLAQYEIELRRLAKDCAFPGYDDEMILDRLLSTCGDEKLQHEVLAKDWDLETFMKHATMKQDIKALTDDMKSEIKAESSEFLRATYAEMLRGRSSKQKMYSFKNTENPVQKNTRFTKPAYTESQQKCLRCGYDVSHNTCPAIGKQCNSSGKLKHFSSCCRTRLKDSQRLIK